MAKSSAATCRTIYRLCFPQSSLTTALSAVLPDDPYVAHSSSSGTILLADGAFVAADVEALFSGSYLNLTQEHHHGVFNDEIIIEMLFRR